MLDQYYMGIDLGSVSLNAAVVDAAGRVRHTVYKRTRGRPLTVLLNCLEELASRFETVFGVVVTGSGRKLIGTILDAPDVNEIVTQARAACHFHPEVRTVVEIGGQDSKLIFIDRDRPTGEPVILDHTLNDVCAAGTGSFLDLQAHRLGMDVKDLGPLALRAEHPARISGRCSVFAKSDMVHLLQEGTPKADIVAGLCDALTLNFITNLGKGRPLVEPIIFQGGVAANAGVVKAFEKRLGLAPGRLIIPENFLVMGAVGSAIIARHSRPTEPSPLNRLIHDVRQAIATAKRHRPTTARLAPLVSRNGSKKNVDRYYDIPADTGEVYLGVDVGAVSTNIVLIDSQGVLRAKQYWYTRGEAIETVRRGLAEMGDRADGRVRVCGVGVTGSGRYFIG
ncbi:MAG: CoA activase, partial [Deltaproteobacteria bacterium]|nr:CoA activase [Deltaproteobacteria bacterium]